MGIDHRHNAILLRMQFVIYQNMLEAFPQFLIYLSFHLFSSVEIFFVRNMGVLRCPPTHLKLRLADSKHFDSWLFGSIKNNAT